jgi:hypothetical protein
MGTTAEGRPSQRAGKIAGRKNRITSWRVRGESGERKGKILFGGVNSRTRRRKRRPAVQHRMKSLREKGFEQTGDLIWRDLY